MNKENNIKEKRVEIGDLVIIELKDKKSNITYTNTYQIVEDYIYDKNDKTSKVNAISPLGNSIIMGKIGDTGNYKVHNYYYEYRIINIIKLPNKKNVINDEITIEKPKSKTRKITSEKR